jgi:YgiT-type zinc finger domain-containing protein
VKTNKPETKCPLCGGSKRRGNTTFTVDLGFGVVVVRDVPATVCSLCGTDWIDDAAAERLEGIVNDARKRHNMVEITSLAV